MNSKSNLLVFNFVMDRNDPLLSHQYEAVTGLAKNFDKITVITGRLGQAEQNPKIHIISTGWAQGQPLRNVARLFFKAIPEIVRGDFKSVFFHMTDLQCALLSPLIRFRGRRQYLWYAHTYKSKYLVFSAKWVTGVVTSTIGSCPLTGKFVKPIGQAIDDEKFKPISFDLLNLNRLVHIGRFDKSKNIDLLISSAEKIKKSFPHIELTITGSPANVESRDWANDLILQSKPAIENGWLNFQEAIPRNLFPIEMAKNGCFFHHYLGSLDKTLIEATMLCVPVITLNSEYLSIFGTWSKFPILNLEDDYKALRSLSTEEIKDELARRLEIARKNHSLHHWIDQLTDLLE